MTPEALDDVLVAARRLADVLPDVLAIGLVGSQARGTARPDSDVDLVVLTVDPADVLRRSDWFGVFGPDVVLIRSDDFGAIQERRLQLPDSTVVEVGVGSATWAATDPLDDGTRRVVSDGMQIVYDPHQLLSQLDRAVRADGS